MPVVSATEVRSVFAPLLAAERFVRAVALSADPMKVSMFADTVRFGMARVVCKWRCRQGADTEMFRRDASKCLQLEAEA